MTAPTTTAGWPLHAPVDESSAERLRIIRTHAGSDDEIVAHFEQLDLFENNH